MTSTFDAIASIIFRTFFLIAFVVLCLGLAVAMNRVQENRIRQIIREEIPSGPRPTQN